MYTGIDNDGDCATIGAGAIQAKQCVDEDWEGGNSEPETRFIQDLTEVRAPGCPVAIRAVSTPEPHK